MWIEQGEKEIPPGGAQKGKFDMAGENSVIRLGGVEQVGVLRLRRNSATRSSSCAQDDMELKFSTVV